uniref:Major facilitator superfamily (MFS) profile domain-containing protein n=1 Tax=Ciona savignyi TaxID=51511 RepID=H2YH06_CIOSA
KYASYAKRWFVLGAVVILNLTGAMIWLTFTTVAYPTADYYETNLATVNGLSLVYMISGIPIGAVATWMLERHGLKPALLISAWFTAVGAALRLISIVESIPSSGKLVALFVGQTLCALGQPFSMYAPAKTAATWFPDSQRAMANTIGSVSNPIGVVIAGLVSPSFINTETGVLDVLITMAVPVAVGAIYTTCVMTSGEPPLPPSAGGDNSKKIVLWKGVKKIVRNKNYMVLVLTVGGGIGLYSTFATLLEQLLCPFGYTSTMAGICSAVLTATGVVGAAIVGAYCDITKQFSSSLKVCYVITVIGIVIFSCVFHIHMGNLILILITGIGLFSFGIYPIGVELGAECTYPVGAATASGMIMISGQLQSIILISILQVIGRPMSPDEVVLYNSQLPIYVCTAYIGLLCIIVIAFFRPKYRRMQAEQDDDSISQESAISNGP